MDVKYFDHAATRPMLPEALQTYARVAAEVYGNPSSVHAAGVAAATRLQQARQEICSACGFDDGRLVVVSGGTEANNLVIQGHLRQHRRGRLLIAVDVHPSIWFAGSRYPRRWDLLPLGPDGRIGAADVARHLHRRTSLVCMSHACNETGTVHHIGEVAELCRRKGVELLCDGAQALGHLPLDLAQVTCDYYTFSAHKLGGPRGVGGVLLRRELAPMFGGGPQEYGLRAGTENVAGLAATATALRACLAMLEEESRRLRKLARFLVHFLDGMPDLVLNSDLEEGLPGLLSLTAPGISAQTAVAELDLLGFCLSAGSACHASHVIPSRAIVARGMSEQEALGTLRVSMGLQTSEEDVFQLGQALQEVITRQRRRS